MLKGFTSQSSMTRYPRVKRLLHSLLKGFLLQFSLMGFSSQSSMMSYSMLKKLLYSLLKVFLY